MVNFFHIKNLLLILSLAFVDSNVSREGLVINTNVGSIQGIRPIEGDFTNYTMFMGIPFAVVDERNPFGPSTPYPNFEETFDAVYDSVLCPQIEEFNDTIVGTLDCLQLNIYVPDSASASNPLPVLIWIYGGGFQIGYANRYLYGPSYLVRHDVIFVTINYRIGPYGFMCLNTPEVPGNQGLKDQLLGLRWIKDNIEFFGGDPNRITLFGQSAGSFSVHLQLLSPQEELFHQIIMHSGSAYTAEVIMEADTTAPIKIAEKLGFTTNNMNEAMAFISAVHTDSVIEAVSEIDDVRFWPCVETDMNDETIVLDYTMNQDIPKIRGMPVLLGFNDDETIMIFANRPPDSLSTINIIYDHLNNYFNFDSEQIQKLENIFANFYLGGKEYSAEMLHEIANFHSDCLFTHPIDRCVTPFLENGSDKIYFYVFSYLGERNFVRRKGNVTIGGAAHTDEIGYLFDMEFIPEQPNAVDQLMIDRMTTMWTNFVKYGDPTPQTSTLLPVKWEPITAPDSPHHYIKIDLEMSMDTNPFHQRMSFWDLFYDAHMQFQIGYKPRNSANNFISRHLDVLSLVMLSLVLYLLQ